MQSKYLIHTLLGLLIFLTGYTSIRAQGVEQQVGNTGFINWGTQVIRTTGIAGVNPNLPAGAQRAGALEAAKLVALRNLLQVVQGVNVTSETTVRNAMIQNDIIRSKLQGVVRHFTIVDTRYMPDASVEVDVEVPLTGVLADALLPADFGGGILMASQALCPMCGQPWPQMKPVPTGVQLVRPSPVKDGAQEGSGYTGLIINAKRLEVTPAMAPKILDESGKEVYGSKFVDRQWAVKHGMVGYGKDINHARNNSRVADNPLVINALRTSGPNRTDVVISNHDAQRIHQAAQFQNFLDNCRVMFIVD